MARVPYSQRLINAHSAAAQRAKPGSGIQKMFQATSKLGAAMQNTLQPKTFAAKGGAVKKPAKPSPKSKGK